jgi:hypothetical protein
MVLTASIGTFGSTACGLDEGSYERLGRSHRAHGDCQRTIELRRAEGHEERGLLSIQPRRVRPGRDADDSQ